jgi:hypothetical protein
LAAVVLSDPAKGAAGGKIQTAKWKVIVEGAATATHGFSERGQVGLCTIDVSGTVTHAMTLQRGKGVTFVAVKKAGQYGLERVGNNSDITLVVRLTVTETGEVNLAPTDPTFAQYCPPFQADLSQGCPKNFTLRQDFGFKFEGDNFALVQAGDALTTPQPNPCVTNQYTTGLLTVVHGFPTEPEVATVPFPFPKFFTKHRHAFKVDMTSGQVTDPQQTTGTPPLIASLNDDGMTDLTVRFVPVP